MFIYYALGGKELSPVDKDRMMAEKENELKREERLKKHKMKVRIVDNSARRDI